MYNYIEIDNLSTLLQILLDNRDSLNDSVLPFPLNLVVNNALVSSITNSLLNSRSNISAHYDLGNAMFEAFLDESLTYSCPIWQNDSQSLYEAQMNKIHTILDRACIKKNDLVLEIGSGWGSLAIEAVKRHQCKVITITLSKNQLDLAQKRISALGLEDHITVMLIDYRNLDPSVFQFDRIISVEMLEAVGPEYLHVFFEKCNSLMKQNATLVIQTITMPESRYENYCRKTDFIQKHIFPGGHCPSLTAITNAVHRGTRGQLSIDLVDNIGPHYAKALRLWRQEFLATFDQLALDSDRLEIYNDEFKRKWEFCVFV
jgi:cyclopropane-fatty-acyl-phospholipid synthase